MDARLQKLIADYQHHVAKAVGLLVASGIERPTSDSAWALRRMPDSGELNEGYSYVRHGVGCVVRGPDWAVDFDFGPEGEVDGFDAGRLLHFTRGRLSVFGFASEGELRDSVEAAAERGEVARRHHLLYFPS